MMVSITLLHTTLQQLSLTQPQSLVMKVILGVVIALGGFYSVSKKKKAC